MKETLGLFSFGAMMGLMIAAAIGWVMNIMAIFDLAISDGGVTAMFILRCVGVFFAPLGAVLGWL